MPTHSRWLLALAFVVAACNGASEATTTTTSTTQPTTTTTRPTTTTTPPTTTTTLGTTSPINGLPVEDPALLDRRLLAVKLDNHPSARPQAGVEKADAVIEMLVEGVTRFITLWHQSDSDYLGPMRSGRPTDPTLLAAFNQPTFAISGAQDWVQQMIRDSGVHLIGEVRPATFRISGRRAPHNLYVDTTLLREHADSLGYPDDPPPGPMWEFGPLPSDAAPTATLRVDFLGNPVEWTWDQGRGLWMRTAGGQESSWVSKDGTREQIGFPVLVVLFVEQYRVRDLPSSRTTGSGQAYVLAEGKVVEGTWQRDEITGWFTLTGADGDVIPVPPGRVWVSLVPTNGGLSLE